MEIDHYTLRYSRHLALPEFGAAGQEKLRRATALIVGLGGLGSPAALYLTASGVGTLLLNDFDRVDLSNLQRQVLHTTASVGWAKTDSAANTLAALNPECRLELLDRRLLDGELEAVVGRADVVLDASDNFGTRFALNAACVKTSTPLISGAAIRYEGQMCVFNARIATSPCYACLYPEAGEELENCRSNGILAPVVGVIGSFMAVEAVKLLSGAGRSMTGKLLRLDVKSGEVVITQMKRDPACPICRSH
ncbi:MAG: molybdopterin-synthase adenylyltransferase MoeB [Gammaproteobacteria bacterium]